MKKIKNLIKKILRYFLNKKLKDYMKDIKQHILKDEKYIAVDVGAAIGVQTWWFEVLEFGQIYAYEPHKESAKELESMYKEYNYTVLNEALDSESGTKEIYLTNVRTGSSLLKPNEGYIYSNPGYFSPYSTDTIETIATYESLSKHDINDIDLMKIDTQGTELNILKGLGETYLDKLLVVEFEAGMPGGYLNQPHFTEVHEFMSANNFDLFDLRSARGSLYHRTLPRFIANKKVSQKIHEVDVLYFKDLDYVLSQKRPEKLRKLIVSYCVYSYFDEAIYALEKAKDFEIFAIDEIIMMKSTVEKWHNLKSSFYGHFHWFNYMADI